MDPLEGHKAFIVIGDVFLITVFCFGLLANTLVLAVFYKKSGLRTVSNRFVINLMVINTVSCITLIPIYIIDLHFSSPLLRIAGELFSILCSSVIVYAVLLISIDQYFAVVKPLRYHTIIDSFKSIVLIISTWVFSTLLGILGAVDPFQNQLFHSEEIILSPWSSTEHNGTAVDQSKNFTLWSNIYKIIFSTIYIVIGLIIPFVLINFIYYKICDAASGQNKRSRHSGSAGTSYEESHYEYYSVPTHEHKLELDKQESDIDHCDSLVKPCLVLTRPSPPKFIRQESDKCEEKCLKSNSSLPNLEVRINEEMNLLKPTKLSCVQFSKSTEKMDVGYLQERRLSSNLPIDFESLKLTNKRSPSIQSELQSKTSRSPSIHSNSSRNPVSRASSIRSTSSFLVNSLRHRISNASLFRYREEARAARISALVIVMGLTCWFPYFTVYFLRALANMYENLFSIPYYLDSLCVMFLLLSTIISPCLFAFRNKKIKKEIKKFFNLNQNELNTKNFYNKHFSVNLKTQYMQIIFGLKNKEKRTDINKEPSSS